jgi:hypothetical protein
VTTRPQLVQPQTTIKVMRDAYREDDAGLFLHTLGRPVLREYSEHLVRVGWSEIRPKVGAFVDAAEVVEAEKYRAENRDVLVSSDFVWPEPDAELMRVRLRLGNDEEDFLFEQELDDAPETAKQAKGFWIGDRYFVRSEHPSPGTYQLGDSPESERTQWRLVFPYHPFQQNGPLTARLQAILNNEKTK